MKFIVISQILAKLKNLTKKIVKGFLSDSKKSKFKI